MPRALFGLLFFGLLCSCTPTAKLTTSDAPTTFYLVRHAEKEMGTAPGLTPQGTARAEFYATFFKDVELSAIYSTDTRRTIETSTPVAKSKKMGVTNYASGLEFDAFAKTLLAQHAGTSVFVVGHSNTIPLLINALTNTQDYTDIPHDDFEQLVPVITRGGATAQVRMFRVPVGLPGTSGGWREQYGPIILEIGDGLVAPGDSRHNEWRFRGIRGEICVEAVVHLQTISVLADLFQANLLTCNSGLAQEYLDEHIATVVDFIESVSLAKGARMPLDIAGSIVAEIGPLGAFACIRPLGDDLEWLLDEGFGSNRLQGCTAGGEAKGDSRTDRVAGESHKWMGNVEWRPGH